jgi:hypothetical protein
MVNESNRREFAAIPIVAVLFGIGAIVLAASSAGMWAWLLAGAGLLVVGVLALTVFGRRHRHPAPQAAPTTAAAPKPRGAPYRVLVIADDSCTAPSFTSELLGHAAGRAVEALVIAPSLRSWLAHWTDDDGRRAEATRHLDETVRALGAAGIPASGATGSDDPIEAADDGLRTFAADEIVFATHPHDTANWLERGVVDLARKRYGVPVTHIVVGR